MDPVRTRVRTPNHLSLPPLLHVAACIDRLSEAVENGAALICGRLDAQAAQQPQADTPATSADQHVALDPALYSRLHQYLIGRVGDDSHAARSLLNSLERAAFPPGSAAEAQAAANGWHPNQW